MSEQVDVKAGSAVKEFNFRREYIDVCIEEDGEFTFAVGGVATREGTELYAREKAGLTAKLNGVFEHFGIEPARWVEYLEDLKLYKYGEERSISGRRIRARGETKTAGEFIHDSAFWAMPMEGELDGEGKAVMSLRLSDDHILEVIGKGTYGRERYYKNPGEERPTAPYMTDVHFEAVNDEDDPEYLGYQDWHRISFKGRIISANELAASTS